MYLYALKSGGLEKVILQSQHPINKGRVIAKSEKVLARYNPDKSLEDIIEVNTLTMPWTRTMLGLEMSKVDKLGYKDYQKRNPIKILNN